MINEYEICDKLNSIIEEKWIEFLALNNNSNFFQSPQEFRFFSLNQNINPLIIVASKPDESIVGILCASIFKESDGLKGYFSKRCIVWGGPLCDNKETALELLRKLNQYADKKAIYIEFRNLFDITNYKDIFKSEGYSYEERINYVVKIESVEINKKKLNENRRRQINKSLKTGAKIIQPVNIEQVKQFYYILQKLYSTKVNKPLPSYDFFEKFYKQVYFLSIKKKNYERQSNC